MAEAARTVKYHVSDFLKDRHPYNRNQSFETQRERDAGKSFDGFDALGLQQLLSHLLDSEIDITQRAVALRHLLAHSASAEVKIKLIRSNVVGTLAAVLTTESVRKSVVVESLVHQLLRSLCILPQGCVAVLEEGALPVILQSVARRDGADRDESRFHAASALAQITSNWGGRAWLLGLENTKDFELASRHFSVLTDAQRQQLPEDVLNAILAVMEKDKRQQPRLLQQVAHALSALSSNTEGLHKSLIAGGLRVVALLLASYAEAVEWMQTSPTDADVVLHLATYVWHAGLDPVGLKEALEHRPLLHAIERLMFASTQLAEPTLLVPLKGALTGALGALVLHPDLKAVAVESTVATGSRTAVAALIALLSQVDALAMEVLAAKKKGAAPPYVTPTLTDLTGVVKNGVQALRLVAELPAGRAALHTLLPNDDAQTEKIRRTVFFSTPWQEEFDVHVY